MSYTVDQQQGFKEMPVGTDWVYTVDSSNATGNYKFKYVIDIFGGQIGITYLGQFKFSPNASGKGIIKIDEILSQYLNADNLGAVSSFFTCKFKGVSAVSDNEPPIHCIDKFSLNTNSVQRMKVRFGEEYSINSSDAPTIYQNIVEIDDLLSFNGVAYNNEDKYVSGNYGIDLTNWGDTGYKNYLPNSSTSYLLTDAPLISQYIGSNDYGTLSFLTGDFSIGAATPSKITVNFYNGNSLLSTFSNDLSGNGGYDTGTDTGLVSADKHIQFVGVGLANFKNYGTTPPANTTRYTVALYDNTTIVSNIYEYIVTNDADCKGFEKIRITWLNKFGTWDYYNFTKKNTRTTGIKRTEFDKVKGNWYGDTFVKYGYGRGRTVLNSNAIETLSLNSDWFRSDEEAAWLEQLFISPEVYILKGYDAADSAPAEYGNYMIPVIITNKSYDKYTEANDKVAQYNLDIEYAINKRIQRG